MQNSAATYVWQPLVFDEQGKMSLPEFHQSWKIDTKTGRWATAGPAGKLVEIGSYKGAKASGDWKSNGDAKGFADLRSKTNGDTLTIPFTGTRIGFHGVGRPDGGFGKVELKDSTGKVVLNTVVETYCLYPEASLKFLSPKLKRGDYTMTVTVLGEHFYWKAKMGDYGSTDDYVSVQKLLIEP